MTKHAMSRPRTRGLAVSLISLITLIPCNGLLLAAHPHAAPGVTSLTNPRVVYRKSSVHHVVLQAGDVTAVIVDNNAVTGGPLLANHRAGYNGVAQLTHKKRPANIFRAPYAGLNYEHIHDGTLAVSAEKFEPRVSPLELRIVDRRTVELYQPPTKNWKLESCGRYQLLEDGSLEYTFECIPRARTFRQGYIGLFWASYIDSPKDKAIHFRGRRVEAKQGSDWIRWLSPAHGVASTHPPAGARLPKVVEGFPLTLVNHPSPFVYRAPWYYGVSHGMSLAQVFRARDRIWMAQSPTGGGQTNPAWDFQWFVPDYRVGQAYGFVMRMVYVPFSSREQLAGAVRPHLEVLNRSPERDRRRGTR
jgi:hypothetical protein